ncbi:ATP-binding cassette domain-containing protein [Cognatitamlana onchidii]|uniref:ATP-binding cassette domain-containing protein n=1 Tax=Cognatitamlana onchidii TaxID=2562860 RepID=UPI0010A68CED|nr:ATP-binding cassette domain-containing protein [Algibacter onchidii]
MPDHCAIYISNNENKKELLQGLSSGNLLSELKQQRGAVFSNVTLNKFIEEEERHGRFDIKTLTENTLKNSSEGERKKALLNHLLSKADFEYLVLDNVFDGLDIKSQSRIKTLLFRISRKTRLIQVTTRKRDVLFFTRKFYVFKLGKLNEQSSLENIYTSKFDFFSKDLPKPVFKEFKSYVPLIALKNVSLKYGNRGILDNISWEIQPNEFWQLVGPNGSGKSTMVSLISGDNPRAYGQNITLFDIKKGSGESVWDIKKNIGFYASELMRGFKRNTSVLNMIISGFVDSVGLYKYPTDEQKRIAYQWLELLNMNHLKQKSFQLLSDGHKRLVLIARAMVKHPPLLILDEPINGLDDHDIYIFSQLVNKIAKESRTAIIYISHREELYIKPDKIFKLIPSNNGSIGKIGTP